MDISGKHIAILVDNYFEQPEFEEPMSALRDAGAEVTVIGVSTTNLTGLNHADKGDSFSADILLAQASSTDYDAIVLPGGAINSDSLRTNEEVQQFVTDFLESNKPTAIICHAPWILVSADQVDGRRLTSYPTIRDDITNAGGDWVNETVVVDDNLITSRNPDDIPAFNEAIIEMLKKNDKYAINDAADTILPADEAENENVTRMKSMGYDAEDDGIDKNDEADILLDNSEVNDEEFRPSNVIPNQERDK